MEETLFLWQTYFFIPPFKKTIIITFSKYYFRINMVMYPKIWRICVTNIILPGAYAAVRSFSFSFNSL